MVDISKLSKAELKKLERDLKRFRRQGTNTSEETPEGVDKAATKEARLSVYSMGHSNQVIIGRPYMNFRRMSKHIRDNRTNREVS